MEEYFELIYLLWSGFLSFKPFHESSKAHDGRHTCSYDITRKVSQACCSAATILGYYEVVLVLMLVTRVDTKARFGLLLKNVYPVLNCSYRLFVAIIACFNETDSAATRSIFIL